MRKAIYVFFIILINMLATSSAAFAQYIYAAVADFDLPLYLSPDEDSLVVEMLPSCSKLELVDREKIWGLVNCSGKCGWVNMSYTRDSYNSAAEATGRYHTERIKINSEDKNISLYSLPSDEAKFGSSVKYSVPDGMVLNIKRETQSGWGLVSIQDEYAWIKLEDTVPYVTEAEEAISKHEIYYVYVLSHEGRGLDLSTEPGGKSVICVIPDCTKLTVRETYGEYAYVSYNGNNGWIELKYTANSLKDAQMNAGIEINCEYEISNLEGESSVSIVSVPSHDINSRTIVGNVNSKERVFVLRSTFDGWLLVNYNGVMGWIAPGKASEVPYEEEMAEKELIENEIAFVSTNESRGMSVYSSVDKEYTAAVVPECTKMYVLARKGDFSYVSCDFAAGWAESRFLAKSYEKALTKAKSGKNAPYITTRDTSLMTLPTDSSLCKSEVVKNIGKATRFEVLQVVGTGKEKWAFTSIDGKDGWINLATAERRLSTAELITILVGVSVCAVIIRMIILKIRRKKILKKERNEQNGKKYL